MVVLIAPCVKDESTKGVRVIDVSMKILHVITGMRKAAGMSVFAGEVANELVAQGHEVAIAVVDTKCDDCYKLDPRVKLIGLDDLIHSSSSTSFLNLSYYDIVHIHALWDLRLHKIAKQIHSPAQTRFALWAQTASSWCSRNMIGRLSVRQSLTPIGQSRTAAKRAAASIAPSCTTPVVCKMVS